MPCEPPCHTGIINGAAGAILRNGKAALLNRKTAAKNRRRKYALWLAFASSRCYNEKTVEVYEDGKTISSKKRYDERFVKSKPSVPKREAR